MKANKLGTIGLSLLATLTVSGSVFASSHREAPAISDDPAADNTDTYAWRCVQDGTPSLCIAANYNPMQLPQGGPNYNKFSDDVLYQLHVTANDKDGVPSLLDYATINIRFKTADTQRVDVADLNAPPGGGKEFFAQLAGRFNQTAKVTISWPRGVDYGGEYDDSQPSTTLFDNVPVAPPNIGQRTSTFVYKNPSYEEYAKTFVKSHADGYKFFAGPRDDPFYVNLGLTFDLASQFGLNELNGQPFRTKIYDTDPNAGGKFASTDPTKAKDGVAGLNVHAIVFSIPIEKLAPPAKKAAFNKAITDGTPSNLTLVGVWASASRQTSRTICPLIPFVKSCRFGFEVAGKWKQVSRLALPLINEAVIGYQDKDLYNRTTPANDVKNFAAYFLNPILVRDAEVIRAYESLGIDPVPQEFKTGRVDILQTVNLDNIPSPGAHSVPIENGRTGDVIRVDLAVPSGFPNGRSLSGPAVASGKEEDVTDVELSLILAKDPAAGLTDSVPGPGDNGRLLKAFPYMGTPFAGDVNDTGRPATF